MQGKKRHQVLAKDGAYEILKFLYERLECPTSDVFEEFLNYYSRDHINNVIKGLDSIFFIQQTGDSLRITEDGSEAFLLLKVINGVSLESVIDELSVRIRSRWSLITKDISNAFFKILSDLTDVKDIMICSPWIRLEESQRALLFNIMKNNRTKISVITRSPSLLKEGNSTWRNQVVGTLRWMKKQGIEIVAHPNLHTKLYIIESKQQSIAVFGSENLTSARNIELAIQITDQSIIGKLISYWTEILSQSKIVEENELNES